MNSVYFESNSTSQKFDEDVNIICFYPRKLKNKYITGIFLVGVFWLWGYWFIDDPGWFLLGIITIVLLFAYYVFRVKRQIEVHKNGVIKRIGIRTIFWNWKDIESIIVQDQRKDYQQKKIAFRRVVLEKNDNHEIILDSNMDQFERAFIEIKKHAGEKGIRITFEKLRVILPFW